MRGCLTSEKVRFGLATLLDELRIGFRAAAAGYPRCSEVAVENLTAFPIDLRPVIPILFVSLAQYPIDSGSRAKTVHVL